MAQRDLVVRIVGDSSSYERALKKSERSTRRFQGSMAATGAKTKRSFAGIFPSAKLIGAAGVAVALKQSVTAASDLEQQVSKTNVVFGQSAAEVEAWAKTLAESFGLSEREALTLSSTFGALFAPLGIVGKQAADQSTKLVQLGADLASFYNTDVQDALDAIQSGLVGQARPLRRYGVLLDAARVQQEALNETGKKSVTELTNQEKVLARITLLFKDSKKAQGDFARTSDTAANQAKIFKANVANLEDALGKHLLPTVTLFIEYLNFLVGAAGTAKDAIHKFALSVAADAVTTARKFVEPFSHIPGAMFDWARRYKKELTGTIAELRAARAKLDQFKPEEGPPGVLGPVAAPAAGTRLNAAAVAAAAKAKKAAEKAARLAKRSRIRAAQEAFRQQLRDRAEFNVEKAGATAGLKDDLAALRKYNALLTKQMKGGHKTLELEREQFRVQQQIADVLKQQADLAKKTKKRLGVDVTRFQASARGQLVTAGAHGGARAIHIANLNLTGIRNVSQLENELNRRSKQRAHQRRRR